MRFAFLALALLHVTPIAAQSRLARPVIDTINHRIARVTNGAPTAWVDTNGWKLLLERTIQPGEGAPGALGDPVNVMLLGDGRVLVYDEKPAGLKLFDARGRYVRTIGREGSGPGEFRFPAFALRGDTIVVHDAQLTRASLLSLDGKLLREFPSVCCQLGAPISVDQRGRIRVTANRTSGETFASQWIWFDLRGRRLDSLVPPVAVKPMVWEEHSRVGASRFYVPLAPQTSYAFLHDGRIAYGSTGAYDILISSNGRDTVRVIRRTGVTTPAVPNRVRDSLFHHIVDKNELARAVARESDIPDHYGVWSSIHEDGAGNLWVWRSSQGGQPRQLDVFSPDGSWLGAVPAPDGRIRDTWWTADHVAVLDEDQDDLPRVRIFRIVK